MKQLTKILWIICLLILQPACKKNNEEQYTQYQNLTIPKITKILGTTSLNSISNISQDGTTITFTNPPSEIQNLAIGDVSIFGVSNVLLAGTVFWTLFSNFCDFKEFYYLIKKMTNMNKINFNQKRATMGL